jgi:P4 family phage/plasmid primase-like protien
LNLDHLTGALAWWDSGMAVIPAMADGSKRPYAKWKDHQEQRATRDQVENWFKTTPNWGVGIVCGQVSGNLELLEIEAARMDSDSLDKVESAMIEAGVHELWEQLTTDYGYCETTPSGGIHILYRITDQPVPGNQKIAMDVTGKQTLAETRGEGGFVVVAPSSGTVHKSGQAWTAIAGSPGMPLLSITWDQRQQIHTALKEALDERVLPAYERPAAAPYDRANGMRPGDAYDADPNVTVHDILLRTGWKYLGKSGGQDRYVHPASSDMSTHSAVTGHRGSPNLYAWSGLPKEDYYTPFGLLTYLEFNGDFSAATRWLREQGYGDPLPSRQHLDVDDWGWGDDEVTTKPATGQDKPGAKLRFEQFTEKGVGLYAGAKYADDVRYVHQEKDWRVYRDGVWRRDTGREVNRMVTKVSDALDTVVDNYTARAVQAQERGQEDAKELVDNAKKMQTFAKGIASRRGMDAVQELMKNYPGVAVPVEKFDKDRNVLAMANGTFDLNEMKLREHRPSDMVTKELDFAYDPDATADRWLRYLEEVLPDPEIRAYLQRAVGMALLGDTSEGAFFVLWGETGCGKSQFLEVLNAVFGDYGATAAASAFRESRNGGDSRKSNSLHALRGARVVLTSETSKRSSLDEELIKRVTGGDTVTSFALYESEISWKPQFTMFMGTNFKPTMDASDGAIWRRVKPINFPNSFFENGRPTEAREKDLGQHVIDTELQGVFNWCLAGVEEYRKLGLADPESLTATVAGYREDSDPVQTWLNEASNEGTIILEEDVEIQSTRIHSVFSNWLKINNLPRVTQTAFGRRLETLGYKAKKNGAGIMVRKGLTINPTAWQAEAQGYGRY